MRPDPPDIARLPREWFHYWDEDGSQSLEKDELIRALIKTFRFTQGPELLRDLSDTVNAIWPIFDTDGNGCIDMEEFIMNDGLRDTILASLSILPQLN